MKKPAVFIACLFIAPALAFLTGCWSSHEVNKLALCSAMGIDKTAGGYLITEQLINPTAIASKKPTAESPVVVYTVEGESVDGAVNYLSLKTSRRLYNAHLRMVVFGEEVAKDGIKSFLDYFMRSYEYRPDFLCVIARGASARDILCTLTPLESISAVEMFSMLKLASEECGATNALKVIELINSIASEGMDPAISGVEIEREAAGADDIDAFKKSGGYDKLKFGGLGAFSGDRLIGWLTEEDSKGYNYINNKIKASLEVVQCGDDSEAVCNITEAKAKTKADVREGRPSAEVSISVKYAVSATKGGFDITKPENEPVLNRALEDKIKLICEAALERAQKQLQTDIFGFGEAVHRKDPAYWKKVKDKWSLEYAGMPVDVSVKAELKSIGEITKSLFAKKEEG